MAWNFLGWQSMLLLIISLFAGLEGKYSNVSRLEYIVFGLFGTLFVNVFRMNVITAWIYYINEVFAKIVHDYVAVILAIIWLIFFWWFSYRFVLE
ncbi:hypothetical protein A3A48_01335 [Candidatus Curtissbacteria bacterium RIFCSPLOWO2_01_FULL_37_9]|uniref:Exosortase H n=1 Tax=Candidatus Curtissbacteria bacterium RIFCSPLOWO2_01_FULL_37_9 TaxID=1797724 RepID=A0A1F5GS79_9BACT|nr:MAG: hypothetical protein A3A48_01335 [Candidatus Curtissbacteria bacterium RIFCSPLOWO2_01_FULL_37_9]